MQTLDFGSVVGVATATLIITQVLLGALNLPADSPGRQRFGPFVALIVAIVLAFAFAFSTGGVLIVALELGITATGSAIGIHDLASSAGVPI